MVKKDEKRVQMKQELLEKRDNNLLTNDEKNELTLIILEELKVDRLIVENPRSFELLKNHLDKMNFEINEFLTMPERLKIYRAIGDFDKQNEYYGMDVDNETGFVRIQKMKMAGNKNNIAFASNVYRDSMFMPLEKEVAVKSKFSKINMFLERPKEVRRSETTEKYNSDGIIMDKRTLSYVEKNERPFLKREINITRDTQYPFISRVETLENSENASFGEINYMLLRLNELAELTGPEHDRDKDGNTIATETIVFDTIEEVKKYYQRNEKSIKEIISTALHQRPKDNLDRSLKNGMKRLLVDAELTREKAEELER